MVASGGDLLLNQYYPVPGGTPTPGTTVSLPRGIYLITYAVNASVAIAQAATAGPAERVSPTLSQATLNSTTTATVGIAPKVNGIAFPRGGSFATIPFDAINTYSTMLTSTFIVEMPNVANTLGFQNTATMAMSTDYELLNVTVQRVG